MIPIEILIPESIRYEANQLAACKGLSMADIYTFGEATHERNGVRYIVVGVQVSDTWLQDMAKPIVRPAFDTESVIDITAAQSALSAMTILQSPPISLPGELPSAPVGMIVCLGVSLAGIYGLSQL